MGHIIENIVANLSRVKAFASLRKIKKNLEHFS